MYTSKIKNIKKEADVPESMITGQILMNSTGRNIPLVGGDTRTIGGEWTHEIDEIFVEDEQKQINSVPTIFKNGLVGVYKVNDERISDIVNEGPSKLAVLSVYGSEIPGFKEPLIEFVDKVAEILEIPEELMPIVNDATSCFAKNAGLVHSQTSVDSDIQDFFSSKGFYASSTDWMIASGGLDAFEVGKQYTDEDLDLFLQVYSISTSETLTSYTIYDPNTGNFYIVSCCDVDLTGGPK